MNLTAMNLPCDEVIDDKFITRRIYQESATSLGEGKL